ncbi:MAG: PEP-CTERM sorting domain-containing protein [Lentisphaeria bacterium]|nr:PEP-CTERM sorting domain-containing protein [Lentisphaeria bacterium]
MKKIPATLLVLLCSVIAASAASLKWQATNVAFDGTKTGKTSDITGYLIYLSSGSFKDSYTVTDESTGDTLAASIGSVVAKNTTGPNALSTMSTSFSWTWTADTDTNPATPMFNNGDTFAMLLAYTTSEGTYYNLSSKYELSGISMNTSSATATFGFNYGDSTGSAGSVSSNGGWAAVPEPSTAALALAGLALLLKRRKA